jgi:hypothetical protein
MLKFLNHYPIPIPEFEGLNHKFKNEHKIVAQVWPRQKSRTYKDLEMWTTRLYLVEQGTEWNVIQVECSFNCINTKWERILYM